MRRCEACRGSLEGRRPNARFCSDACRARAWKAKTHYGPQPVVSKRSGRDGKRANGGLQISYRRAVRKVAIAFYGQIPMLSWSQAIRAAEETLAEALPARQRERLAR